MTNREHNHREHDIHDVHHGGMAELYEHRATPLTRLYISIAITVIGMAIEVVGGLLSGSIALLSDAGHMFTHIFALGISAFAVTISRQGPCHHRTFGLLRAEVLAAYTNAIMLFGVIGYIIYEAIIRILNPVEIHTAEMLWVASVGLVVNILSIALLSGHKDSITIRSAVAHMLADTLSSVAIVIGAVIIARTSWTWLDPLMSVGIALVILRWAWLLFKDSSRILMEVAPEGVTTNSVEEFIKSEFPDVLGVDRMRIWSITEGVSSFTARAHVSGELSSPEFNAQLQLLETRLREQFGFTETTLELTIIEQTGCSTENLSSAHNS